MKNNNRFFFCRCITPQKQGLAPNILRGMSMNVGMMACYDQAKGTMMSVSQPDPLHSRPPVKSGIISYVRHPCHVITAGFMRMGRREAPLYLAIFSLPQPTSTCFITLHYAYSYCCSTNYASAAVPYLSLESSPSQTWIPTQLFDSCSLHTKAAVAGAFTRLFGVPQKVTPSAGVELQLFA